MKNPLPDFKDLSQDEKLDLINAASLFTQENIYIPHGTPKNLPIVVGVDRYCATATIYALHQENGKWDRVPLTSGIDAHRLLSLNMSEDGEVIVFHKLDGVEAFSRTGYGNYAVSVAEELIGPDYTVSLSGDGTTIIAIPVVYGQDYEEKKIQIFSTNTGMDRTFCRVAERKLPKGLRPLHGVQLNRSGEILIVPTCSEQYVKNQNANLTETEFALIDLESLSVFETSAWKIPGGGNLSLGAFQTTESFGVGVWDGSKMCMVSCPEGKEPRLYVEERKMDGLPGPISFSYSNKCVTLRHTEVYGFDGKDRFELREASTDHLLLGHEKTFWKEEGEDRIFLLSIPVYQGKGEVFCLPEDPEKRAVVRLHAEAERRTDAKITNFGRSLAIHEDSNTLAVTALPHGSFGYRSHISIFDNSRIHHVKVSGIVQNIQFLNEDTLVCRMENWGLPARLNGRSEGGVAILRKVNGEWGIDADTWEQEFSSARFQAALSNNHLETLANLFFDKGVILDPEVLKKRKDPNMVGIMLVTQRQASTDHVFVLREAQLGVGGPEILASVAIPVCSTSGYATPAVRVRLNDKKETVRLAYVSAYTTYLFEIDHDVDEIGSSTPRTCVVWDLGGCDDEPHGDVTYAALSHDGDRLSVVHLNKHNDSDLTTQCEGYDIVYEADAPTLKRSAETLHIPRTRDNCLSEITSSFGIISGQLYAIEQTSKNPFPVLHTVALNPNNAI